MEEAFRRYSRREYLAWRIYDRIEPINKLDSVEKLVGLAAFYASTQCEFKRGRRPTVEDFVPDYWPARAMPKTRSELNNILYHCLGVETDGSV